MPRSGPRALNETSSLLFGEDKYTDESASATPRGDSPIRDQGSLNTVKSVHQFCASEAFLEEGAVTYDTFKLVCGRGFAPWEVHRPQQAVRELLTSGCFASGSVLDCGCGLGDNSLFIAKYTTCTVDGVDMLPQCIAFAEMKSGLRNMRGRVGWHCFDLLKWGTSPLAGRTYDVVLDSGLLQCLDGPTRLRYLSALHALTKPGGNFYVLALSDLETAPGGPPRVSRGDLEALLSSENGWTLSYVKPQFFELHPTFWSGKGKAYLAAAQRA